MAQLGSAPALGAGGRRFESSHPDHTHASVLFRAAFLFTIFQILHDASEVVDEQRFLEIRVAEI